MVNWTYKWYKPDGPMTIEEIANHFIDLILHSILTDEAKQKAEIAPFFMKHQPVPFRRLK
jgi:TetR/AcrR family transcriptional regulator, cholesterol catabolism regulator